MTTTDSHEAERDAQIAVLIAGFEQACSPFDRSLDRLAAGFATIENAISSARYAALPLSELATALALGRAQLAGGRAALHFGTDERGLERYADSQSLLIDLIEAKLADPRADAKAIGRIDEDFMEHEPAARLGVVGGLRGAWLVRQAIAKRGQGGSSAQAVAVLIGELRGATWSLDHARAQPAEPDEPFGARFAAYLARYTQLAEQWTAALAGVGSSRQTRRTP
jgi:hypothetical protein